MSCPSWQWHSTGSRWSPVQTLPVEPLLCDLRFVPNSRGNKAAANLRPMLKAPNSYAKRILLIISLCLTMQSKMSWREDYPDQLRLLQLIGRPLLHICGLA